MSSKGGKWGYRPSISELADTTGSKSGQSGSYKHGNSGGRAQSWGLLPAPWVSTEIFEGRCSTGKCSRCGSANQKVSFCPKYTSRGNPPQQQDQTLVPNRDGGPQVIRQKAFSNQQPNNSWASLSSWPDGRGLMRRNWVWQGGDAGSDGDNGQHKTASVCFEVKVVVVEPKRSHVKSVLMRHVQIGHVP